MARRRRSLDDRIAPYRGGHGASNAGDFQSSSPPAPSGFRVDDCPWPSRLGAGVGLECTPGTGGVAGRLARYWVAFLAAWRWRFLRRVLCLFSRFRIFCLLLLRAMPSSAVPAPHGPVFSPCLPWQGKSRTGRADPIGVQGLRRDGIPSCADPAPGSRIPGLGLRAALRRSGRVPLFTGYLGPLESRISTWTRTEGALSRSTSTGDGIGVRRLFQCRFSPAGGAHGGPDGPEFDDAAQLGPDLRAHGAVEAQCKGMGVSAGSVAHAHDVPAHGEGSAGGGGLGQGEFEFVAGFGLPGGDKPAASVGNFDQGGGHLLKLGSTGRYGHG